MATKIEDEVARLFSFVPSAKATPSNPSFAVTDVDKLLEDVDLPPPPRPPLPTGYSANPTVYTSASVSIEPQHTKPAEKSKEEPDSASGPSASEEVDKLTSILLQNMQFAAEKDFFGMCHTCNGKVMGADNGCQALGNLHHVSCFVCVKCKKELVNMAFYRLGDQMYCEADYFSTLEKCAKCNEPIREKILHALDRNYHPECFVCSVCGQCLDGVSFTADANDQIYCLPDFHQKFAPRCGACGKAIVPEEGENESFRVVALEKSFHLDCYKCEACGLKLSSKEEGHGCYPLDGHLFCLKCHQIKVRGDKATEL